jgi:hypothetical protein
MDILHDMENYSLNFILYCNFFWYSDESENTSNRPQKAQGLPWKSSGTHQSQIPVFPEYVFLEYVFPEY